MSELMQLFKNRNNQITETEILDKFLSADEKNIAFRTHLTNPLAVTIMETIRDTLRKEGFTKTADVLESYIFNYKCNMVSYNRLSRIEVSDTLKGLRQAEITEQKVTQQNQVEK